ncbi:hypothetical protein [Kocuria varians]|uniref:hypothetical protein n=1 Tax=Kocuria varians TaxID=1272 RepID=UPI000837D587|nr:hypothetical protein [Kocuria varians]
MSQNAEHPMTAARGALFGNQQSPAEPAPEPAPAVDPREDVATRYGLPVDVLRGSTTAEVEAHAEVLTGLLDARQRMDPIPAQGHHPSQYRPPVNPLRNLANPGAPVPHDAAHPDYDTAHKHPGWIGH